MVGLQRSQSAWIVSTGTGEAQFWHRTVIEKAQTEADFVRARDLILATGALQSTLDLAADYAAAAKADLTPFADDAWKTALEDLADFAVSRGA